MMELGKVEQMKEQPDTSKIEFPEKELKFGGALIYDYTLEILVEHYECDPEEAVSNMVISFQVNT